MGEAISWLQWTKFYWEVACLKRRVTCSASVCSSEKVQNEELHVFGSFLKSCIWLLVR